MLFRGAARQGETRARVPIRGEECQGLSEAWLLTNFIPARDKRPVCSRA